MNSSSNSPGQASLTVVVNGQSQLDFDRGKKLPEKQLAYLDRMDRQMDAGLRLAGAWIDQPDRLQRAQFVAVHLITALQQADESLIAASCAYLASRLPDLQQVKAKLIGDGFSVELVFDRPHVEETTIDFIARPEHPE
jgi:hypothetical protein